MKTNKLSQLKQIWTISNKEYDKKTQTIEKCWTVTTTWTMTTKLDNGNKVGTERQTGQRGQM